ncbi:MAG: alpha-amylase [Acidobacteria bacterium]|nr:MAG: alpha-amylase [Acidobacteriota bacterium]
MNWWHDGVLYQIYPRSFADASGDGVGDLAGIAEHLDYIASLGVSGIWLSPIYRSPMADFGYDIADYREIDPLFGDMAAFDHLLEETHSRGLKLVMDFVPNHTSDEHEWFKESRSSRDNPKRDWYIWRDPGPDGEAPNNWPAAFGTKSAWTLDESTGQYYLHLFLPEQPDLNWQNPDVRAAMHDVMRFWFEKGVDGFRIDVIHMLFKNPTFEDNPPGNLLAHVPQSEELHEIVRGLRAVADEYEDRMLVGETFVWDIADIAKFYGNDGDELHLAFNFPMAIAGYNATYMSKVVDKTLDALPFGARPCWVLSNHDLPRHGARYGADAIPGAALLLLGLPGTPFIYAGEEIGMTGMIPPPERQVDPGGRDAARTPFQWSPDPNAGFCPPTVEPWLPIAEGYETVNAEVEDTDPGSVLNLYRRAIAFRNGSDALLSGDFEELRVEDRLWVFKRTGNEGSVIAAVNLSGERVEVALEVTGDRAGRIVVCTSGGREGEVIGEHLELAGFEAAWVAVN